MPCGRSHSGETEQNLVLDLSSLLSLCLGQGPQVFLSECPSTSALLGNVREQMTQTQESPSLHSQALQLVAGSLRSETTPSCGQAEVLQTSRNQTRALGKALRQHSMAASRLAAVSPYLVGTPAPALGSEPLLRNQCSAPTPFLPTNFLSGCTAVALS